MTNIQSTTSNINFEEINHATLGIRAISTAILNDSCFVDGEIAEYVPLENFTIGGLHYALEGLAAYIDKLSESD